MAETILKNRQLRVFGVFMDRVADALERHGIARTEANIKAAALHVENVASAYAKAVLADSTRQDWEEALEESLPFIQRGFPWDPEAKRSEQ